MTEQRGLGSKTPDGGVHQVLLDIYVELPGPQRAFALNSLLSLR